MAANNITPPVITVQIDSLEFQVTRNGSGGQECILWIRDKNQTRVFEALGWFSEYEKRRVLEFITRYVTSPDLREEISKKRFELHLETLTPSVFTEIETLGTEEKHNAFRTLFNLDSVVDQHVDLGWKRRVLAKRFHPDRGGSTQFMTVINEGYEQLHFLFSAKKK
jgi:hypothetical protein